MTVHSVLWNGAKRSAIDPPADDYSRGRRFTTALRSSREFDDRQNRHVGIDRQVHRGGSASATAIVGDRDRRKAGGSTLGRTLRIDETSLIAPESVDPHPSESGAARMFELPLAPGFKNPVRVLGNARFKALHER